MSGLALALVVCAAVLHATWNALAKRAENQFAFLWSSVSLATLLLLRRQDLRVPGTEPALFPVEAGHGLWLARQVAAPLDLWSGEHGTRAVITFRLPPQA